MPKSLAGMGTGTNTANLQGPTLPREERTDDVEAWRERMDAKRAGSRTPAIPLPTPSEAPAPAPVPIPRPAPPTRKGRTPVDEAAQVSARVVTAWFEGDSPAQIAEQVGRSTTRVYQLLKAAGVDVKERSTPPNPAEPEAAAPVDVEPAVPLESGVVVAPYTPAGRNVDAAETAAIVAAYAAGASAPEIAAAHGRRPNTVRRTLDRAGVTRRDDRTYRSGGANTAVDAPELVEEVAGLYASGMTQAQVADHLGVSQKVIQGVMSRNGIEARPDATGTQRTRKPRPTRPAPPPVEIPTPPAPAPQCSCWPRPMDDRHGHACDLYDDQSAEEPVLRAPLADALTNAAALAAELTRAIPPIPREDFTAVHTAASPTPELIAALTGRRALPARSPGPSSLDLLDVVDVLHTALIALHEATSRLAAIARDLPPLRSTR